MGELTQQIIDQNKAGVIVFLVLILLSNVAFGLFSTKYRFKSYIVYILYALFVVYCCLIAKFFHDFAILFISIYLVYIALYVLCSSHNVFKGLFSITSYLIFFSVFFGFCFLLLNIQGPYGIVIRWVFTVLFYVLFETFIYLFFVPTFKKAAKNMDKGWPLLFIGDFLYLAIMFMNVFYPFHLSSENPGGIILFVLLVVFYLFVFFIIINSFATSALYGEEKVKNIQLQEFATKDILTSLYNKNYLSTYTDLLIKERKDLPINNTIVAIFDINKFKDINDTYGHIHGDEVLKSVASTMKSIFKEEDMYKCFRFGGDEFIIVALDKDINEITYQMLQLKSKIKEELDVTISSGFYYVDYKDIDPLLTAIKNADKAMYLEKFKNKVKR